MNYSGISKVSIVDGPGVRVVLWVSGCRCKCPGCHNKELWDFDYGKEFDLEAKTKLRDALSKPYILFQVTAPPSAVVRFLTA